MLSFTSIYCIPIHLISPRLDSLNIAQFIFPSFHLASILPALLQFIWILFTSFPFTFLHFDSFYFISVSFISLGSLLIFLSLRPKHLMIPIVLTLLLISPLSFPLSFPSLDFNSLPPQVTFLHFTSLHFVSPYQIFCVIWLFQLLLLNLTIFPYSLLIVTE